MSFTVTLTELRLRTRRRADMESSLFVQDDKDEVDFFINSSIAKLHNELSKLEEGSSLAKSTVFYTSATDDTYDLPSDFERVLKVLVDPGTGQNYATLDKFSMHDLGKRRTWGAGWNVSSGRADAKYRVVGQSILFAPAPQAIHTIELWYMPAPTRLTASNDTWTVENIDWVNFVAADAAIPMLLKEESDTTALEREALTSLARVLDGASPRDLGEPERVRDVTGALDYYDIDLEPEWRRP